MNAQFRIPLLPATLVCTLAAVVLPVLAEDAPLQLNSYVVKGFSPLIKVGELHMKQARKGAAAVADGNYIYIVGGLDATDAEVATIERLNLATSQIEEFARLKTYRVFHRVVIVGRKLYILGGVVSAKKRKADIISMSDPSPANGNRTYPYPGDPRVGPAVMRHQSANLHSPELFLDSVEYIDLDTREQGVAPSMPVAKAFFGSVVYDGKIFVIGGKKAKGFDKANTNSVEVFDPKSQKWSKGTPMPTPRQCEAVVVDDFILVPGGYDGHKKSSTVEFFVPEEQVWKKLPDLASPISASALVRHRKYLFLFGDYDSPEEVVAYDLSTRRSEVFTFSYTPGRHAAAVASNDRIFLIGGATTTAGTANDTIQIFTSPP